jgi:hypothetical protein
LATPILVLVAVAIPVGFALAEVSSIDHVVTQRLQLVAVGALLSGVAALVLLLWARQLLPLHRIVILYACGTLAHDVLEGRLSWKFDLQLPLTLLALALIERRGLHRRLSVVVVMAFGLVGLTDDSRSYVGFCAVAAALTIWQRRPRSREPSRWYPAALMALVAVGAFLLAQALLTGGYLGAEVQERTMRQADRSGSVLAGGRPEWAATRELVRHSPWGYGLGVVPNWEDLQAGKAGLESINVELESNRQRFMFGGQLRLHSIAADLWAGHGWAGVALALLIAIALVRSLSFTLAARRAPTSVLLLGLVALWFTLFGPLHGNWLDVCVALGLLLVPGRRALETDTSTRAVSA